MSRLQRGPRLEQFVRQPVSFLQHPAVRWKLPGSAARLLNELASRHNGRNNGAIFCSQREAKALLGMSQDAIEHGFAELEARGIIVKTSPASWPEKKAPTWRLTMLADNGDSPTNEYRLWTPKGRNGVKSLHRKPVHPYTGNRCTEAKSTPETGAPGPKP